MKWTGPGGFSPMIQTGIARRGSASLRCKRRCLRHFAESRF
ncbi:Unknown protein sequence [Pseudomonas syringae pv. cilantro]|uniref:Uncharacterized protein n=1 Tax=Pseudomonas syringae pv. cilantro TaxID=81035 RepID=A0A0N0XDG2_PSESX|nr:Unknown protein sequence [Pseudomonas syringae pv. cilantro]